MINFLSKPEKLKCILRQSLKCKRSFSDDAKNCSQENDHMPTSNCKPASPCCCPDPCCVPPCPVYHGYANCDFYDMMICLSDVRNPQQKVCKDLKNCPYLTSNRM